MSYQNKMMTGATVSGSTKPQPAKKKFFDSRATKADQLRAKIRSLGYSIKLLNAAYQSAIKARSERAGAIAAKLSILGKQISQAQRDLLTELARAKGLKLGTAKARR